jgi:hypothetical protein
VDKGEQTRGERARGEQARGKRTRTRTNLARWHDIERGAGAVVINQTTRVHLLKLILNVAGVCALKRRQRQIRKRARGREVRGER